MLNNKPELTIIMTCYNQEDCIRQAVDSLLNQQLNFDYKLIITDDNSTEDNSKEVIKELVEKYSFIEAVFAEENAGYLVNVLRGKRQADTKYLCLLDSDDYYTDTHFLQDAYDFLESHPDYTVYEANVNTLKDGVYRPFVNPKFKSGSYDMKDLVNNSVPVTQTTGQFFRNVIYSKGVPEVVEASIGDKVAERSWEGDTTRFLMHLKWGKAYYSDKIIGVYRITPNGIWTRMKKSSQFLYKARVRVDYCDYFIEDIPYWVNKAWEYLNTAFKCKSDELASYDYSEWTETEKNTIKMVYGFCIKNKELIRIPEDTLKDKIKKILHILKG